jgi:hypothetical protein
VNQLTSRVLTAIASREQAQALVKAGSRVLAIDFVLPPTIDTVFTPAFRK